MDLGISYIFLTNQEFLKNSWQINDIFPQFPKFLKILDIPDIPDRVDTIYRENTRRRGNIATIGNNQAR